jgi:hypothetical protein
MYRMIGAAPRGRAGRAIRCYYPYSCAQRTAVWAVSAPIPAAASLFLIDINK